MVRKVTIERGAENIVLSYYHTWGVESYELCSKWVRIRDVFFYKQEYSVCALDELKTTPLYLIDYL